ncbi:MAG: DUF981 family protein [Conexivisphaerales archaeon]
MALFIDILAIQLFVLGVAGITLGYFLVKIFMRSRRGESIEREYQVMWPLLLGIGIYSFVTGLWGQLVWPLPGSYNILFYDLYAMFGLILTVFAALMRSNFRLEYAGFFSLLFGAITMYYGASGFNANMTSEPAALLGLYLLWGLAGILTYPFALYADRIRAKALEVAATAQAPQLIPPMTHATGAVGKTASISYSWWLWIPVIVFLAAGLLALYIGINALPGHLVAFSHWAP